MGIPDDDTWAYNEGLSRILVERGLHNIKLRRVMDLMGLANGRQLTRKLYLSLCDITRRKLLREYGKTEEEIRQTMQDDNDTLLTYRGFIRFLETDLRCDNQLLA